MNLSRRTKTTSGAARARPWLICCDLRAGRLRDLGLSAPPPAMVRLLREARSRDWEVAHVLGGRQAGRRGGPIAELAPLRTEPVFDSPGLSAFANSSFADAMFAASPRTPVYLCGFGLGDMIAATVIVGAELGRRATVVADAVAGAGAGCDEQAVLALLRGFAPQTTTAALFSLEEPAQIRLVKGEG